MQHHHHHHRTMHGEESGQKIMAVVFPLLFVAFPPFRALHSFKWNCYGCKWVAPVITGTVYESGEGKLDWW